jgi:predicted CoA-binding protein
MNVAVLGASNKPDRYSYKAVKRLEGHGHTVFPVHPKLSEIEGIKVYASLADLPEAVDTITVYLSPENSDKVADEIVAAGAKRVIFNPDTENRLLSQQLRAQGVKVIEACTLVMLGTGEF